MRRSIGLSLRILALAVVPAWAQTSPAPIMQAGVGPTGSMYNGNNLVRSPVGRAPKPPETSGSGGVTGTSARGKSSDSTGGGAGGGEH